MELRKSQMQRNSGKSPSAAQMQAAAGVLSAGEKERLLRRSNFRGFAEFGFSLGLIGIAGAAAVVWPHPVTWLLAWLVFGTRQLALAVLMHEASHGSLFRSRRLNHWIGAWFCAAPLLLDLDEYRATHQQHHLFTGVRYDGRSGDPDLVLVRFYPLTRKGLSRWLWRDLTGRVMLRLNTLVVLTRLGYRISGPRGPVPGTQAQQALTKQVADIWRHFHRPIVVYGAASAALVAVGAWPLIPIWFLSWFCLYPLLLRVRLIAEHGMVEKSPDLLKNTRTTLAAWWERFVFAPHHVHYHLEHHLMPAVPCYRLPELHRLLRERGFLKGATVASGYAGILRLAASREPAGAAP